MAQTTDLAKMTEIKELILSKFAAKRSMVDKMWRRSRVVVGQKCKQLRVKKP